MQIYKFMVTNQKVSNFILHCAFVRLYTLRFRIEHREIYSHYVRSYATCAFGRLSSENTFTRILDNIEFLGAKILL